MTVALVSIAINLLGLGVLAGGYMGGLRIERAGGESTRASQGRSFMAALPPERRAEVRREVGRLFLATRTERIEARKAREALLAAVLAEPYDEAAVRDAFAAVRAADASVQMRFQDGAVALLGRLEPGERRAALVAMMRPGGPRGRPEREARPGPSPSAPE